MNKNVFQLVRINIRYVSHKCKAYEDVAFLFIDIKYPIKKFLNFLTYMFVI